MRQRGWVRVGVALLYVAACAFALAGGHYVASVVLCVTGLLWVAASG